VERRGGVKRILIVEDDRALGDGLCLALRSPETELVLCRTLSAARSALKEGEADLLVLDVNLPDGNGLDFLRKFRAGSGYVPVILLTANDMETDIVAGLESGADDYVTKPFSLAVLRARVNAQLRRTGTAGRGGEGPLVLGDFAFDFDRMEFRRDGRLIDLSKTEQKLLRILVENRGRTLPRELLVDRVWTDGAEYVDENALSVTVKRLRGKLEENPSKPRFLKTVYGIGYVWSSGETEG
jgi:DNA-binding response OmpR family regulator